MRIAIFETDHFEAVYPVIRFFDQGNNQLFLFIYEPAFRQLSFMLGTDMERYHWIIRQETTSPRDFIHHMLQECRSRQIDLVYFNTISNNFIFYAAMMKRLPGVRKVVTLHDINNYFEFRPSFSLRRIIRYIGRRWIIRTVQEFNVIADTMVPYLEAKLPASRKVYNIPGGIFESWRHTQTAPALTTMLKIVVPGTVDSRRRNYDTVFQLFEQASHLPVSITLLGTFSAEHGTAIKQRVLSYAATHNNLRYFEEPIVDQPVFDRHMQEAHLVFIPSVINTVLLDGAMETYGLSITSGNIFDIVKNARPFIVPAALQIPATLESSAFRYQSIAAIVRFLEELLRQPSRYDELTAKALLNSQEFTIEKVRERHPDLLA